MTHHHYYFTTSSPYNKTNNNNNTQSMTIYGIIFIIFGILIIYNYIKYAQSRNNQIPNNVIYQEENEVDGFPNINDFFPAYLEQNRNNHRRQSPVIAVPPPYNDEERRSLQEMEPPSYESILHSQDNSEISNTLDETQSVV